MTKFFLFHYVFYCSLSVHYIKPTYLHRIKKKNLKEIYFSRYAIIVPACLLSYMLGANLSILEIFINLVGGVLYVAVGAVTIQTYTYSGYSNHGKKI